MSNLNDMNIQLPNHNMYISRRVSRGCEMREIETKPI
jgi:hypothetical protein